MKLLLWGRALLAVGVASILGAALAADPIPITADQAFDAVTMQVDPETGGPANVLLIDVRDPVEYFFNGAAGAVTKIHLKGYRGKGARVTPEGGKVRLVHDGKFVEYWVKGHYRLTRVAEIDNLDMEPLAYNVPLWRFDVTTNNWETDHSAEEAAFVTNMAALVDALPDAEYCSGCPFKVILYCRTGGRSTLAGRLIADVLFNANDVYEIDDPAGQNGRGGFSGPAWSATSADYNGYNGYGGFPGRQTPPDGRSDVHASVSWLDSGLPVVTTVKSLEEESLPR
jgi:rhodanese-related sulfurtransferase